MWKLAPNRSCFGIVAALTFMTSPHVTRADDFEDCYRSANPDPKIHGCTNLIDGGQLEGDELADAYYNRGNAYYSKGNFKRAIADYSKAIEITPDYAAAYANRSKAYRQRGKTKRANADCEKATSIDSDVEC